ncbi:acyl-CoA N-acyltransferase [Phaeosphaeria sp. MPI-PUGE-AT-0046c]|nr:acyl-CoA N-acyltransferase [Phaeosphaeria sp. MPI-PUGE-AT-0046c]
MATTTPQCIVRPAESLDEAMVLWWPLIEELGWNRAKDDAKTHWDVAQNGKTWLVVAPDSTNKPEGMILPILYPNNSAWIGFFIMNAESRGKGLGRALWKEMELVFAKAGTTTIGLDAVPQQVNTYARRGYVDCARIPLMMHMSLAVQPIDVTWGSEGAVDLQDLRDIDSKELAEFDFKHTGLDRSAYWAKDVLPARRHAFGYGIVDKGKLTGCIHARRCPKGARIGPLYAASYPEARQLLHKVMDDLAKMDGTIEAEIFGSNEQGQRLFEELGWEYMGMSYHRMWLNGIVPEEQKDGGRGTTGMYATLDAGSG